jgi:hypothetical protein
MASVHARFRGKCRLSRGGNPGIPVRDPAQTDTLMDTRNIKYCNRILIAKNWMYVIERAVVLRQLGCSAISPNNWFSNSKI